MVSGGCNHLCCTLNTTFISSNPTFEFPFKYRGVHIEKYNKIIRDTANQHNCKIIDLYRYHIPYDSMDGSHPNADGMNTLATMMIREIAGKEVDTFMDCENMRHEYFLAYKHSGITKYICKKCGKFDEYYDVDPPSKCPKC